ncbi:MAG: polysaccharide lyase family 7 protein [Reichenbachiella sp.]
MNFLTRIFFLMIMGFFVLSCGKKTIEEADKPQIIKAKYPSDVIANFTQWKILLGNGERSDSLENYERKGFFYTAFDETNWVVYKTPNRGVTSKTSHNTRTELGEKKRWIPEDGGKLNGTLKVKHVSTTGDARVAASYSVVVGQIHSDEGHENEPLKIFYKKFPGHRKGSVFWTYEINTEGDNSGRWDFSTSVWGYDMSVVGPEPNVNPAEPEEGIKLGEEFSYEVNVYEGIMYLTFKSEGHKTKTFTKNLKVSEFVRKADIPEQVLTLYRVLGRDGTERTTAYAGELQYFKQGAYNQTNGDDPSKNMVWSTGSETYEGDLEKQYANGSYTEVWFLASSIGPGTAPVD